MLESMEPSKFGLCFLLRWTKLMYRFNRAERLRLESAEYHGPGWSDEGHDLAIDWIQENIFARADELESDIKIKAWDDIKKQCEEMHQACQQVQEACKQIKEASQQNPQIGRAHV